MNKCMLIGNLTRDPELRTTNSSGISICTFTLAVSRRFANQQGERDADFIPIVVWRQQAENCARYLRRGSQVAVSGMIQTRSYDANDGTRRYVTEVVADEVQFLNRTAGKDGTTPAAPAGNGYGMPEQPTTGGTGFDGMDEIEEDLPF